MKRFYPFALMVLMSCDEMPFAEKYCWTCSQKLTQNDSRARSGPNVLSNIKSDHCDLTHAEIKEVEARLYKEVPALRAGDNYSVHCYRK